MKNIESRRTGSRSFLILFSVTLILLITLIGSTFYTMYGVSKENLISLGQDNTSQFEREVLEYFRDGMQIVEVAAARLSLMMRRGAGSGELHSYLVDETDITRKMVNSRYQGLYGVFQGEYLDGLNFVPGKDYVPEERPWYKAAVGNGGSTVLVAPYRDEMTKTDTISISRLLDDRKSVVSMDLSLEEIQKLAERVNDDTIKSLLVLDDQGQVVVHRNPGEVGKNYLQEGHTLWGALAEKLYATKDNAFEVTFDREHYMVYVKELEGGWYVVTMTDEERTFAALEYIYNTSLCILFLVFVAVGVICIKVYHRRLEAEGLNAQLESVASIYISMHLIDVVGDTFSEIRSSRDVSMFMGDRHQNARQSLSVIMDLVTDDQSKNLVAEFIDLDTLDERMGDAHTITQEFQEIKNGWCRGRFVVVDRLPDGTLHHVLWMVELIDEERRSRERLKYLSETDLMTGTRNRGSGEHKIKEMLEYGECGMFCLLDADRFKSINDTYGHGVGDQVIIEIAHCLKRAFRESDIVMRLGGDEFVAFAIGIENETIARKIIGRFFDNIEKIQIPEMGRQKVTVSMGVVLYGKEDDHSFQEIYRRADRCTYRSKKMEGNYVTFYSDEAFKSAGSGTSFD